MVETAAEGMPMGYTVSVGGVDAEKERSCDHVVAMNGSGLRRR